MKAGGQNIGGDVACNVSTDAARISPRAGSLGAIVRSYKAAVCRRCRLLGFEEFAWQARYYDHIIRSERSLDEIRRYITDNPARWREDTDNPANL